jgi:hypothetical protein
MLPEKNIVGKSGIDRTTLNTVDWLEAKENANISAAKNILDTLWTENKTRKLKELLGDTQQSVFISVPSTSGQNVVASTLAERLATNTGSIYIRGEDYFYPLHNKQSKHISRAERLYSRRYFSVDHKDRLKEVTQGKKIVVVEDVLTTGGTVAAFTMALHDAGIAVNHVVGLMGDARLAVDFKTIDRLDKSMKAAGLENSASEIASRVTRSEAGVLIMSINSARSKNAKDKISGNLSRLLDQRAFKNLGRDKESGWNTGRGTEDRGDAQIFEGVPVRNLQKRLTRKETAILEKAEIFSDMSLPVEAKEKFMEKVRDRLSRNKIEPVSKQLEEVDKKSMEDEGWER